MARYIFITGGVVSSLGKGLASAALGALLQARGYSVRLRKLDPYLNVDPGTMSPFQHGEVYVTDDGAETDLDLGHYERFTGVPTTRGDNVTTGQIYQEILRKERRGEFLGVTVQVVPHVTDAIKEFILADTDDVDFCLCEIGGTVGDIEGLPFFEAIRQLRNELPPDQTLFLHLTLLPFVASAGELKTKPTQHSVKELRSIGIQPDILLCRSDRPIAEDDRRKIGLFCNVHPSRVIPALDASSIYAVPVQYHREGLDTEVLRGFGLHEPPAAKLDPWYDVMRRHESPEGEVRIAVVGKYTSLKDAYKSLDEALVHGGIANSVRVIQEWIPAEELEQGDVNEILSGVHGLLIPGGFGARGAEGKIAAAGYARTHNLPYFGICFGMQMAAIEAARSLADVPDASSSEFGATSDPIIGLMTEWTQGNQTIARGINDDKGGTMRLGAYDAVLSQSSRVAQIYGTNRISERHRHRFEMNMQYREQLERHGVIVSGVSPDGLLPEIIEIPDHPWFIGVQFHPELKSRPFAPHPLFASFIKAAVKQSRLV